MEGPSGSVVAPGGGGCCAATGEGTMATLAEGCVVDWGSMGAGEDGGCAGGAVWGSIGAGEEAGLAAGAEVAGIWARTMGTSGKAAEGVINWGAGGTSGGGSGLRCHTARVGGLAESVVEGRTFHSGCLMVQIASE